MLPPTVRTLLSLSARVGVLLVPATLAAQVPASPPPGPPQAKIVSAGGTVERTAAEDEQWLAARVFDDLYARQRVRTLAASRAAILFVDETQVKLNANAILTVQAVRQAGAASTILNLLRGEGWFRTKNPASGLTIQTPAAAAAVRGTEVNIALGPDDTTVLTVVEGSVELSNTAGSILVNAGEEGTARPGQAPTKRVVLNPEDAVQWALYYPARVAWRDLPADALAGAARAGFEQLRQGNLAAALAAFGPAVATEPWAAIGASMAHAQQGNVVQARDVLARPFPAALDVERRAQLAAVALATGDARAAREAIDALVAQDPSALRPLVLLSTLELTQNHPELAAKAAAAALAAHPESVAALRAASEAAQALFDLPRALDYIDRAVTLDPADVAARVNRARLRFGMGDTAGARRDIEEAERVSPGDPQVSSMSGFVLLAAGQAAEARSRFDAAVAADQEFGEPHLGLGLLHFRAGRVNDGLLEMLTATLLEPKVSLYQSYLGKAYHQASRFPEGLSALASAKRLDPRDPTPWLYTAHFLRDRFRPAEALDEISQAITLNDNRAVYRSRLLLDRDLASKNVSLAEFYRQLGFDAWGAFEAQNSLDTDFTNASAHLFLAETYGQLPDRTQALGSELLQYLVHAPVNRNSFNNFNEYTALLEQPGRQFAPSIRWGNDGQADGLLQTRSGNDRFAHIAAVNLSRENGFRDPGHDSARGLFFQGKMALSSRSDVFLSLNTSRSTEGQSNQIVRTLGRETDAPVIIRQFIDDPDPNLVNRFTQTDLRFGARYDWRPGSAFTAAASVLRWEQRTENPDYEYSTCTGINLSQFGALSSSHYRAPIDSYDVQAQQATRLGRHQLIVGAQFFEQDKAVDCVDSVYLAADGTPLGELTSRESGRDRTATAYVRDEIAVASWLHVTLGLRRDDVTYVDLFDSREYSLRRWNPMGGASIYLGPSTVLRVAALRNLNSDFTGSKLSPSTVSGFVVERNEQPTAIRKEANASLEHAWPRAFAGVRAFLRDTRVPTLLEFAFSPEAETRSTGASLFVNLLASRRVSVFADDVFARLDTRNFLRTDNKVRVGVNFVHERGFFARIATSYVTQRFSDTPVTDLPRSGFGLADLDLRYEFADRRGALTFTVDNLFERRFNAVVEGLSVERIRPDRRALLQFRWRVG